MQTDNRFYDYINKLGNDVHNFDPFKVIHQFIRSNILSKYPNLVACNMYDADDDDLKEYYIQFGGELSFNERKELQFAILEDIYNYCVNCGFPDEFRSISLFLSR